MNIYDEMGFKSNPFETKPLSADKKGAKLMVGREGISKKIIRGLVSSEKYLTVEGLNGVGKTSVINVAVYKAAEQQVSSAQGPLFIPCRKPFQLKPELSAADFKKEILYEIAQTLIEARDRLPIPKGYSKSPNNPKLNRWLNSIEPAAGGFNTPVGGVNYAGVPNQTDGFSESGFEKAVMDWLKLIFPSINEGGVVCIIDNLELLQTSKAARELIEAMRDDVLSMPGIRWVLCGALGIIQGVASSPRMAGYLQRTIEIKDLDHEFAKEIYRRRIEHFKNRDDAKFPMAEGEFEMLFQLLKGNLRSVLSECDNYAMYIADLADDGQEAGESTFSEWFEAEAESAYKASQEFLGRRAMEIFEVACGKEAFSPSEFADFGCTSGPALTPHVKSLETVGLVVSSQDEGDKRRRTVQVTAKGWKVKAHIDKMRCN